MADGQVETYYEDGKWKNKVSGALRPSGVSLSKAPIEAMGRQMAIDRGVAHVIRSVSGDVVKRSFYSPEGDATRQS